MGDKDEERGPVEQGVAEAEEERYPLYMGRDQAVGGNETERGDGGEQTELCEQHPAATAPQQRQHEAIEQRRPEEFPGVGKLDEGKQSDGLEVYPFGAQPGGEQVEQQEERQPRGEAGEHADEHAPGEELLPHGHRAYLTLPGDAPWLGKHLEHSSSGCVMGRRESRRLGDVMVGMIHDADRQYFLDNTGQKE